ncbi:MAG: DUF3862 domain-containing protein [Pyrinomonadaceae bacterium]
MRKSYILVLVALLFVVLGCKLGNLMKDKEEVPSTPASDTTKDKDSDSDKKSSSSGAGLTMESYEKIKPGMSYDDVAEILGDKGTETRSSTIGNSELKSYKWEGDNFIRIYVNFKDDKVTSKNQTGLKGNAKAGGDEINMEKYEKIKNGMSLKDVQAAIGSDGEETSSSSIGNSTYETRKWSGANYSYIMVSFRDDKVSSKSQYGLK